MQRMNMRKRDRTTNGCSKLTTECNTFYSRLSQLISEKKNLSKSTTMNWIRTKVCFILLNRVSSVYEVLERFSEKYQNSNVTLMFHGNMPKFELQNSNILAHLGETSLSHLNYYYCVTCFNPFRANV